MAGRASPFAALTGAEKQIKWLEVQSVKLPYVHHNVDGGEDAILAKPEAPPALPASPIPPPEEKREPPPKQPSPPRTEFQKTRHSQYDAVIARMKMAEKKTNGYQALG